MATLLTGAAQPVAAQGFWDDFIRAVFGAGKVPTTARLTSAATRAERIASGVTLAAAARTLFLHTPLTDAQRAFVVVEEGKLVFTFRNGNELRAATLREGALEIQKTGAKVDFLIEQDDLASLSGQIDELPENAAIYLANYDGPPWPVVRSPVNDELLVEVSPKVLVRSSGSNPRQALVHLEALKTWDFSKKDASVLAFFDRTYDDETVRAVESLGQTGADVNVVDRGNIAAVFAEADNSIVVVVGHHEDGRIIVRRGSQGGETSFRVADLESEAARQDKYLMVLGCSTAKFACVGTTEAVNSIALVQQLERAFAAPDFVTFLDLATPGDTQLIVDEAFSAGARVVIRGRIIRTRLLPVTGTGHIANLGSVQMSTANVGSVQISTGLFYPGAPPAWQRWMQKVLDGPIGMLYMVFLFLGAISALIEFVKRILRRGGDQWGQFAIGLLLWSLPLWIASLPAMVTYIVGGLLLGLVAILIAFSLFDRVRSVIPAKATNT